MIEFPGARAPERLTFFSVGFVLGALLAESRLIRQQQRRLFEEIVRMSTTAVTRAQMDQGLQALIAAEAARDAAVNQAFTYANQALTDLLAKVAAGSVTTQEDFTAELNALQSLYTHAATTAANAAAITQTATADDPGPTAISAAAPPATAAPTADPTAAAGSNS